MNRDTILMNLFIGILAGLIAAWFMLAAQTLTHSFPLIIVISLVMGIVCIYVITLFGGKTSQDNEMTYKVIDPENLGSSNRDNAYSKNYDKLDPKTIHTKLKPFVNGRKVKCWRLVKCASDSARDEFIPIFR